MIRAFIFTLLAAVSLPAQSTGILKGKVTDPQSAAVAGASVRIFSRSSSFTQTALSGDSGDFQFDGLPTGQYFVEARTTGFDQASPLAVTVDPSRTTMIGIKLSIQGLTTRVLVTASSTPVSTDQVSKALDVVDSNEIERRGEISFAESVRNVPGVRVQQLGGPGSFTRILTRGLRAYDTSITIDGARLRDAASVQGDATAFIGDLLVTGADRIEVLRGSGSSLYGSNSIGGVYNIVTDSGGGPVRGEISGEGGGLGVMRGLARIGGGALDNRLQYSAGLTHLNVNGGVDGIENVKNTSGQGLAQYYFKPGASLTARLMGFGGSMGITSSPVAGPLANLGAGVGIVEARPLAGDQVRRLEQGLTANWGDATFAPNLYDPDNKRQSGVLSSMFTWNQQLNSQAGYRVSWHNLTSERNNLDGPAGYGYQPSFDSSNYFRGRYDTLNARADVWLAKGNLLTGGYEWEREYYRNHALDQNPDAVSRTDALTTAQQRSHAFFVQDQARFLNDRLQVSISGRLQHFNLFAPTFAGGAPQYQGVTFESPKNANTGDAAVSYFIPTSGTKIRAHVGNGYRAPALYERVGASFFWGAFSAYGDPLLRPERSVAADAGFDQYFANSKVRVSGTVFYTRLQEVIGYTSLMNDPNGRWGGYANIGGGLARGAELSGEARPWRTMLLQSSYTYTNADERNPILTDGGVRAIRVFPHAVTFVATQQVTKRIQITADFFGANEMISGTFFVGSGTRPYRFEGPRKLDLSASYTKPVSEKVTLRFFVRAENVLNRTYYEDGFRTPKAWATGGMKVLF
ncbi:MAG TPA: TonB-dependent receptor [Bryobacteraceae bacterium]|nr:TonB-dependent receptor [Bryobacteraceae bacterium]